jgi:hypothetical protein
MAVYMGRGPCQTSLAPPPPLTLFMLLGMPHLMVFVWDGNCGALIDDRRASHDQLAVQWARNQQAANP